METLEDKVLCEAMTGSNYRVLAVGPFVKLVAVGDVIVFPAAEILHKLTQKKVFVRESSILAKTSTAQDAPPVPAN